MPAVGLGWWKIAPEDCARVVTTSLELGYRHFDCAADYGNEVAIGKALEAELQAGSVAREDMWVTSKLWNTDHAPEHVRPAIERSLEDLRLEALDLYLIHFPIALRHVPHAERYPPGWVADPERGRMEFSRVPLHETWAAMEEVRRAGLARHIGVCNFNSGLMLDLLSYAEVAPAVLQVEAHPRLAQERLLRFCREHGVVFTAFSPLASASYVELGMADEDESLVDAAPLREAAAAHGVSPAQVALRWGIQRGTAVIPKSSSEAHLRENLELFGFELSGREMAAISALDEGRRYNDPAVFGEAAFGTFCPIYD